MNIFKFLISLTNIKRKNEVMSSKKFEITILIISIEQNEYFKNERNEVISKKKKKIIFEITISFKVNTLIKASSELNEVSFAVTFSWVHGMFASVRRFSTKFSPRILATCSLVRLPVLLSRVHLLV